MALSRASILFSVRRGCPGQYSLQTIRLAHRRRLFMIFQGLSGNLCTARLIGICASKKKNYIYHNGQSEYNTIQSKHEEKYKKVLFWPVRLTHSYFWLIPFAAGTDTVHSLEFVSLSNVCFIGRSAKETVKTTKESRDTLNSISTKWMNVLYQRSVGSGRWWRDWKVCHPRAAEWGVPTEGGFCAESGPLLSEGFFCLWASPYRNPYMIMSLIIWPIERGKNTLIEF